VTVAGVALAVAGVLGLAIGSFLNVVVHRVPIGASVVSPPSSCPVCDARIRARHNVPVAGWLVLRGRCADCAEPIPVRYPLVELLTGALFVLVTWRAVQLGEPAAIPALLVFTALGVALSAIDLATRRLPDVLVLPAYPVLAVLLAAAAAVDANWGALLRAVLGAVVLFGFFFALAVASPRSMGFGDVKLAGVIGLLLGYFSWWTLVVGAFAGFLLGAVVGVGLMVSGVAGRKTAVPFGPFMIAGALLALWIGDAVGGVLVPA
jgi:leader peptidase (prepilin peptidase)/N-methyltransferase